MKGTNRDVSRQCFHRAKHVQCKAQYCRRGLSDPWNACIYCSYCFSVFSDCLCFQNKLMIVTVRCPSVRPSVCSSVSLMNPDWATWEVITRVIGWSSSLLGPQHGRASLVKHPPNFSENREGGSPEQKKTCNISETVRDRTWYCSLIESCIRAFDLGRNRRPWMTLNGHYALYCCGIARFPCDSAALSSVICYDGCLLGERSAASRRRRYEDVRPSVIRRRWKPNENFMTQRRRHCSVGPSS